MVVWWNGRHVGLRSQCLKRVGSSPTSTTNFYHFGIKVWLWEWLTCWWTIVGARRKAPDTNLAKWRNGRRNWLKISRLKACGFESHLGHQLHITSTNNKTYEYIIDRSTISRCCRCSLLFPCSEEEGNKQRCSSTCSSSKRWRSDPIGRKPNSADRIGLIYSELSRLESSHLGDWRNG